MATEEPDYVLVLQEDAFEVRDYPDLIAAEVSVTGNRDDASSAGFRLLAGYIFGGNKSQQSIAMTAPVVQERSSSEKIAMTAPVTQTGEDGFWVVRFIMPDSYTMETLPEPKDNRVRLVPVPPQRFAIIRFSGLAKPSDVERKTAKLMDFFVQKNYRAVGDPSLARYNPPWTPWFMRRNEVWVPVETAG